MASSKSFSSLWSEAGHFNKALSKGVTTTTWIWNLHADAHDFDIQNSSQALVNRKVFSSNLAHLAVVFFWLGGMHFHGAYFSNYSAWLKDPQHVSPSSQMVFTIAGQEILNGDVGGYFQGLYITSGWFQLWRSEGIYTTTQLKCAAAACLIGTVLCIGGAYFHMHVSFQKLSFFNKYKEASLHHIGLLFGLGSLSWSAHQIHIAVPVNRLLQSGVDPALLPSPHSLMMLEVNMPSLQSLLLSTSNSTTYLDLTNVAAHHFYVGLAFIVLASVLRFLTFEGSYNISDYYNLGSNHAQLAINLGVLGSLSIVFSHHIYAMPVYPYLSTDYPTVLSLFVHHMWIGSLFIVGAGAHASIFMIRELSVETLKVNGKNYYLFNRLIQQVICHRDILMGHLVYVCIFLGMHAFGMYIHNDTMQALSRPEDMFQDSAIQLRPLFAIWIQTNILNNVTTSIVMDGKIGIMPLELGTADFLVHHIHAFTIHVTLLILLKGTLYARSSRLVASKVDLGFRYPCDGPGRGGTCQISPWDHVYLGVFWMYNTISVVIFHFSWKMQSDVWGTYDSETHAISHITGDFSTNSVTINGWLRNFLWSQAAQVIQSYGTAVSAYGLIFLLSHFLWAFSLMFLFSGRGYWQELIESILWAHNKLKVVPYIQPRALSISQGRAVGLVHYVLGGIGCTWSFFLARIIALSS